MVSLDAGQKYCRMPPFASSIAECSKGIVLQYFRPSLTYHLSIRSLFCLFLSGRFTQGLLYCEDVTISRSSIFRLQIQSEYNNSNNINKFYVEKKLFCACSRVRNTCNISISCTNTYVAVL